MSAPKLEQLEETRSKGDGPIVTGVPTLEHRHDDTVLPKRRNNIPSKGEIKEGKDGFHQGKLALKRE